MKRVLTYYAPPAGNPSCKLEGRLVDYDLNRLSAYAHSDKACDEIRNIQDTFDVIFVNALDFLPVEQLDLDFSHASKLLAEHGELIVNLFNKKRKRAIEKLVQRYFSDCAFDKRNNRFCCT